MTRNSKKFQKETPEPPSNPPEQQKKDPSNPFGISFVVPTEMVKLPTQGEYYPVSSPLHGIKELEIKHMTAKEEDLLSSADESTGGRIFDKLISSLLVEKGIDAGELCEEDRTALLMSARITGYGKEYAVSDHCTNCGEVGKFTFDLRKQEFINPDDKGAYNPETDLYTLLLPVSEVKVEIKNFNKGDDEYLDQEKKQKEKHGLPHNHLISFLRRVIISAETVTDRNLLNQLIDALPAADAKIIKNFYNSCRPRLSTLQEVECSLCNAPSKREVPVSWAFFWYSL